MANEKFLDAFRSLDTELKANGKSVLEYENSLDTTDLERLKVCRIMRNYMAHNDTTFLSTTNEQIKFLNTKTNELRKLAHTVKDEMKRIKTVKSTESIKTITGLVDKYSIVPLLDKSGIYLVNQNILIHNLALGNKKIALPARLPKYQYVSKLDRLDNIGSGTYIVTEGGTAIDTYVGILIL